MSRSSVDIVRVPVESDGEEAVEEHRDVQSVFPKEGRNHKTAAAKELDASVKDRFVSESQLHAAQESGLPIRENASQNEGKSLAVILAENKQKKEEEFQEQWRTMKQGKNRPLDPDDYEFVDAVYKQEAQRTKQQFDHAQKDTEEFKKARAAMMRTETQPTTTRPQPSKKRSGLSLKPVVKVVVKKSRTSSAKTKHKSEASGEKHSTEQS